MAERLGEVQNEVGKFRKILSERAIVFRVLTWRIG